MRCRWWLLILAGTLTSAGLAYGLLTTRFAGDGEEGYRLELSSFAPTRAYAVGTQSVNLVGTVRNIGDKPLPANTVILRMYAVTGLEYLEGATTIRLPVMEPGAAGTYRWKVQPSAPDAPLVAALVLERPEYLPQVLVLPIQHFVNAPSAFGQGGPAKPGLAASATGKSGWVENGQVRARVVPTASDMAALFLWARTPGGWRQTALAMPLAELMSGEPAQEPWWEALKVKSCTTSISRTQAVLSVSGQIGVRWRATVDLTVRPGSSVVDCALSVSPRRTMQLYGVRTSRLHIGEGSFGATASEVLGPEPVGEAQTQAVRWGTITTGMTWPSGLPFESWIARPFATPDGAEYRLAGSEYRSPRAPAEFSTGSSYRVRWRIYSMTPSSTVRDALKVAPAP